jgi:hypothetical protein
LEFSGDEKTFMKKEEFNNLLSNYLLPMFSGASLEGILACGTYCKLVSQENVCILRIKPSPKGDYCIRFKRSQKFLREEIKLIDTFVREINEIESEKDKKHFKDLMNSLPRRVLSRLLRYDLQGRMTLEDVIQWFESLSSQTYEGKQIVAAFGITENRNYGPIDIQSLGREDFSKVLSNGFDTIYLCGQSGKVFNLKRLRIAYPKSHAPVRMGAIANWTKGKKVAIVLNRSGEILVFKNKMLKFAKRRGAWRYYPHESALKQFGPGITNEIKIAVYQSCIDASFARTGGCIALLTRDGERDLRKKKIVSISDMISTKKITRTKLLDKIAKAPFQNIDRLIRQEILSMDGASVLNNKGKFITAGAIIKVPGGSVGGGRRAAAINLSKWGIGIKISADGPIVGFKKKKEIFSL